jgi:hypothetical protein
MANLCRDQQAAELGDHKRGLGSDDLPAIQQVRVPCLLNSAACHLKLGNVSGAQAGEGGSLSTALTTALRCCAEVLQAGPPAAQRAKAYFRMGQVSATPCRGLPWLALACLGLPMALIVDAHRVAGARRPRQPTGGVGGARASAGDQPELTRDTRAAHQSFVRAQAAQGSR